MKKLVFGAALILAAIGIKAQPVANHLYLGGTLSYASNNYETTQGSITINDDNSRFEFSPAVGYTFADNWLAGIRLNMVSQKSNGASDGDLGVQLFGRYYIEATNNFFFDPELGIGFANDDIYSPSGIPGEPNQFQLGIRPGFAYYPTTHWGIEFYAGFIGITSSSRTNKDADPDIEYKHTNGEITFDMANVGVGISYLLML